MNDELCHWLLLITIAICSVFAMLAASGCTRITAETVVIDNRRATHGMDGNVPTNGLEQATEWTL